MLEVTIVDVGLMLSGARIEYAAAVVLSRSVIELDPLADRTLEAVAVTETISWAVEVAFTATTLLLLVAPSALLVLAELEDSRSVEVPTSLAEGDVSIVVEASIALVFVLG